MDKNISMKRGSHQATAADLFYAYRLILGRIPDNAGFFDNIAWLDRDGVTIDELRRMFLSSPEFTAQSSVLSRVKMDCGIWVFVDPTELDFGKAISQSGVWEPHVAAEILRHVKVGDVFVDVGANVGIMSFQVAPVVGQTGKIIAFEPNPNNVQSYLRGIAENRFRNVDLYPFAISDCRAIFSLAGGSNSYLTLAEFGNTLIQSYIGDDILLREERINFIKLDIEGHEPAALRGLSNTIRRTRPTILCEFNPRCLKSNSSVDPRQFADDLFKISPRCVAIEYDGSRNDVSSAAALIALWEDRNNKATRTGLLPDGMLHFDLLLTAVAEGKF